MKQATIEMKKPVMDVMAFSVQQERAIRTTRTFRLATRQQADRIVDR